jgi:HD-GYP domain-containing protein (c-di-GMP phosphodiesterase class II)
MRSLPLTTRALIVFTVVACAVVTPYVAFALPSRGSHLWWLAFLCAAMVGEALRVSGDGESGAIAEFTFSMAILVAAAPLFGPGVAAILGFASLAAVDFARGEPFYRLVFNAATYGLAGAGAGWAFLAAGGHLGVIGEVDPASLGAAVGVHAAIATGVIGLALASARQDRLVRGTLRYAMEVTPTSFAEYSLGLVLARLCAATPGFVPLLAPLFIAVYRAHSAAVRLAVETKQALRGLADVVDARDPYTFAHSARVAGYVERHAEALGLPDRRVRRLTRAGRLHDLGKLTVDVAILTKPGRLTDAEFDELRSHPAMSARLLAPFTFAAEEKHLVEFHHERFDGHGYYSVTAAHLPIDAHFLILADSWDAMTSDRPYRRALSDTEAAAEIRKHLGTQFHPLLGRSFLATLEGRALLDEFSQAELDRLYAELGSSHGRYLANARAHVGRWCRNATWRALAVPACVLGAVVAVAPHAGSPLAALASVVALAIWLAVRRRRDAVRRTLRLLSDEPHPRTAEEVLTRIDHRLGLIWIGRFESGSQQLRRLGLGWSPFDPDAVATRIDGLLACTDPAELEEHGRTVSRDGSTLVLHQAADRSELLFVTSGPPLPAPLAGTLVQLLTSVSGETGVVHDLSSAEAA